MNFRSQLRFKAALVNRRAALGNLQGLSRHLDFPRQLRHLGLRSRPTKKFMEEIIERTDKD